MITFLNLLAKAFRKKKAPLPRPEVSKEIELINARLDTLEDAAMRLISISGGPGWTEIMQNAVRHLDQRVENLEQITIQNTKLLEQFSEAGEDGVIFIVPIETSEEEIN